MQEPGYSTGAHLTIASRCAASIYTSNEDSADLNVPIPDHCTREQRRVIHQRSVIVLQELRGRMEEFIAERFPAPAPVLAE